MLKRDKTLDLPDVDWIVFDAISDLVYIHDDEYRIVRANRAYVERAGHEREEDVLGRFYWEVFPRDDGPCTSCLHALREQREQREVLELPDGDVYRLRTFPVSGSDGDYAYSVHILEDITDFHEAHREHRATEKQLRALVESSADGVIALSEEGDISYLNPAAERLLGRPRKELKNKPFGLPVALGRTTEVHVQRPDGTNRIAELRTIETAPRGLPGYVVSLHDVTERVNLEQVHKRSAERLRDTLFETIDAMAMAVEVRDPYTAGHQKRVATLAMAIGEELGLDQDRIEGLHVGGSIHDIGKLYVPSEILSRPGKLQPMEFELIKTHCEAGHQICKGIRFPWPVSTMISQHHERLDGSGYPLGLSGDEILLESRILAVADVVEAMATHRPYRPSLGIDQALAEILRGRGTAYDADVVDACVSLFEQKGYRLDP